MTYDLLTPISRPRNPLVDVCMWILHDYCPPDPAMYLCRMLEDDCEECCVLCWQNYLHFLMSGGRDPYRLDRQRVQ